MKVESPHLKRCCFCLPLRKGLIGWGYVNLMLNVLAMIYFVILVSVYNPHARIHYEAVGVFVAFMVVQTSFSIVLVIACHKKSVNLLKVSFIYCIIIFILMLIFDAFAIYMEIYSIYTFWEYYYSISRRILRMFWSLSPVFVQTYVQVYLTLLIRSEMIKLRHEGIEMQFVNNAAEREAYVSAYQPLPSDQQLSGQSPPSGENLPSDQHLPSGQHLSSDLSPSGQSPSSDQNHSIWPTLPPVKDEV